MHAGVGNGGTTSVTTREQRDGAPEQAGLVIREAVTADEQRAVIEIRREVFTDEQDLTDVVDRDPYDQGPGALLVLALLAGRPVGTGRLHVWRDEGQIAWVAVRRPYRGRGIGWEIMEALLSAAGELGAQRVSLSAQAHAIGFYRLLGFRPAGTPFIMGNIEHITMVRELTD